MSTQAFHKFVYSYTGHYPLNDFLYCVESAWLQMVQTWPQLNPKTKLCLTDLSPGSILYEHVKESKPIRRVQECGYEAQPGFCSQIKRILGSIAGLPLSSRTGYKAVIAPVAHSQREIQTKSWHTQYGDYVFYIECGYSGLYDTLHIQGVWLARDDKILSR